VSLEQSIDRLTAVLEKLLAGGVPAGVASASSEAPAKETTKGKAKAAKTTAAEKANATDAEVVGKAVATNPPDDLLETKTEAKKPTQDDLRAALQAYAGTFKEGGTKEARAFMVKTAGLTNADTKLADLPEDKFAVVIEAANKATAERKKAAAETL